ncbi:MAG: hypothetical protein RL604_1608, partial [Pseudomonadota bacterium]
HWLKMDLVTKTACVFKRQVLMVYLEFVSKFLDLVPIKKGALCAFFVFINIVDLLG